jgi:hypothetical protein
LRVENGAPKRVGPRLGKAFRKKGRFPSLDTLGARAEVRLARVRHMAASAVGGALAPSAEAIFLDYASHSREDVRRVFARYDADRDGSLSGVELRNLLRDVGLVSAFDTAEDVAFLKKQLVAADRDGDGAVGFDEFMVYLNTVAAPRASVAKAGGNTSFATGRETKKTGTKISFFAENDLFVADVCASPGTPELAESSRPTRELSRHGTRSRIPTPPASYSRSETRKNARNFASPGSATKFGFAGFRSPATPASASLSGASARPPSSRLARLSTTPRTPLERVDVNARRDDARRLAPEASSAGARFFFAEDSPTASPPKTTEKPRFVGSEDASSSPPETPSPLPAFAGPSRVHDAAGDLLAFVRNLELENERLRSEAAEAKKRAANAETKAETARDAFPVAKEDSLSVAPPTDNFVSAAAVSKPVERAVETFEAVARRRATETEEETSSDAFEPESRERVRLDARTNAHVSTRARSRERSSRRAFAERAAATFVVLLLLAAATAALRGAFFEVPVPPETFFCPAPSPITAARAGPASRSGPRGPPQVEPNVILPRESFPATTSWTF